MKKRLFSNIFLGLAIFAIGVLTFINFGVISVVHAETFTPACYYSSNAHEYYWVATQAAFDGLGSNWVKVNRTQANCSGCEAGYHDNGEDECVQDTFTPACYYSSNAHEYYWVATQAAFNGLGSNWVKVDRTQASCSGCEAGYHDNGEDECVQDVNQQTYTITFKQAQGYVDLVQCTTGSDGIVSAVTGKYQCDANPNNNCVDAISWWCNQWSTDNYANGTQTNNITNSSAFSTKKFTSNATYYCVANSSNRQPSSCGGTPVTPEPEPEPTQQCYKCANGTKEYAYATSATEASSKTGGNNCQVVNYNDCVEVTPTVSCYGCDLNGNKKYVYATSADGAASSSGGRNCQAVANSYCENPPVNPSTGGVAIIVAWVVGVLAIGYAVWYSIRLRSVNL